MSENNDELVKAQNELIGILFEIIKRLQSNNDLDAEYFQIISKKVRIEDENSRLNEITKERENNAEIVSRLLKQIESN
ncbi:MAG: hydrolase [Crenarchaeota archaeon]|nr:hydrolase [Thermoproteota archaeon]MDA1124395.1 hydrolase [Thermoproteota archaeon]